MVRVHKDVSNVKHLVKMIFFGYNPNIFFVFSKLIMYAIFSFNPYILPCRLINLLRTNGKCMIEKEEKISNFNFSCFLINRYFIK